MLPISGWRQPVALEVGRAAQGISTFVGAQTTSSIGNADGPLSSGARAGVMWRLIQAKCTMKSVVRRRAISEMRTESLRVVSTESLLVMSLVVLAVVVLKRWLGAKTSVATVQAKLDAGALVIDVRSPAEFRTGAYVGARNIPVSELTDRLAEVPKDQPVVLYCASGMRSAMAAKLLKRAGYVDVTNAGALSDMPR